MPGATTPSGSWPIVFTSGTTGTPQGADLRQPRAQRHRPQRRAELGRSRRVGGGGHLVASTQFAHIGFMTKLPWYLRLGTTTHLLERWRAADVLALVSEHRMTSIGGVAPAARPDAARPRLRPLRPVDRVDDHHGRRPLAAGTGGRGPAAVRRRLLDPLLVHRVRGRGHGHGVRRRRRGGAAHRRPPAASVEVDIRDDDDRPVGPDEVGELCLRSPCMMRGYWHDPEATAEALRDGWLHTGDLARIDDRGLVRLAGRAQGDVHPGRLQRLSRRGRGGAGLASGGGRRGRGATPRRRDGRDRRGRGGARRSRASRPRSTSLRSVRRRRSWPATSCPRRSGWSTRCR